jgi:hypothetical protein
MQRSVSQLLFNYLPARTIDWEDGLAIVQLGGVRLSAVWSDERTVALLEEIASRLERWRAAGGSVDPQFPDPTTQRGRYTVGLPEAIEATLLNTALVCQRCARLFFPKSSELRANGGRSSRFSCPACRGQLRQFGQVFVHGCGELVAVNEWIPAIRRNTDGSLEPTRRPIRCPRCGAVGKLAMPNRSDRVRDMKITCLSCETEAVDRLMASCERCLLQINADRRESSDRAVADVEGEEQRGRRGDPIVTRIAMRLSRYSASDTFYPQTLSILRLDRPAVTALTDQEQNLLRRMLPPIARPATDGVAESIGVLAQRLQARTDEELCQGPVV